MNLETKKLLQDILEACRDIERYTAGLQFDDFRSNGMAQAAVERKFEIIGEALNRMCRSNLPIVEKISDYRRIIGLHNLIAHGYDAVDAEILWDAARNHLPVLIRETEELLGAR